MSVKRPSQLPAALTGDQSAPGDMLLIEDVSAPAGAKLKGIARDELARAVARVTLWVAKSTSMTAIAGDRIEADTSGGAWTLTLPAAPVLGDTVEVRDPVNSWKTHHLTIDPNGASIDQVSGQLVCDMRGWLVLTFTGTAWEAWAMFGPVGT